MRIVLSVVLVLLMCNVNAQRTYSLSASANFDFLTKGLSTNDAGVGFTVQSNLLAKNKVQLKAETSLDHFIGNKLLMIDSAGKHFDGNPTMLSIKVGTEVYVVKNLSITALYGLVRYKWFDKEIYSGAFKTSLIVWPPMHNNMAIGISFTKLTGGGSGAHFVGINIGFKIL